MHTAPLLLLWLAGCDSGSGDDQTSIDAWTVYGILDSEILLYDQHIVGKPVGVQDVTADCPQGGTVHLTGSTAEDGVLTTIDLVVDLEACGTSAAAYDLSLTGQVTWAGNFRSTGFKVLSSAADVLSVAGTVEASGGSAEVDETCALAVTDRGEDGEASVASGTWCGREVDF